ncbi:phosphate ABC transporter substrate-binding protein [Paenibacillus ginsengarvi]|uniref:Phosphate-binding protein n=2 Tax=Paenibacillus ginsengarvi TaxID=400777 RepID=A0A3B0CM61_9BACL|nr:phosphate ABC transporter substrate-binding protein [Paenibacillus ginsengarvi]RKN85467.1 phosphate ABC transporter substrate-binding protein [Paenibacillus ginsengarvi]
MFQVMSKKMFSFAMVGILSVGVLAGCGAKDNKTNASGGSEPNKPAAAAELTGTVSASGSTALQPLVSKAAQDFMAKNPKVTVNVTGGGSGTGVKNVADGVSDIGNSDVEADAQYKDSLKDNIVVIAPFALIVNKASVGIDNLTKAQAADIFMGKITNWKDVGGKDLKITVVHRPDSSGSRKLVKQIVLDNKDFTKDGVTQDTSKTVAEAVGSTEGSVGYVDVPYIKGNDKIKALKMDGVEYSADNIKSGKYPLYGIEHMYTKKDKESPAVKAFIEFIMSKEFLGKPEVTDLGFLPADLIKK